MYHKIKKLVDKEHLDEFLSSYEFLKGKTISYKEKTIELLNKKEKYIVEHIHKKNIQLLHHVIALMALDGDFENAYKITYYLYADGRDSLIRFTSKEKENEYKEFLYPVINKEKTIESRQCYSYDMYLKINDYDTYFQQGLERCFNVWRGVRELGSYYVNIDDSEDAEYAFQGSLLLNNLGLFDRSYEYLDILKKYASMPHRRSGCSYHPKYYLAAIKFLEELYAARISEDKGTSLRHAANAIAINMKMVKDCFRDEDAASAFKAEDIGLGLCVAIEFCLDEAWSVGCCNSILCILDEYNFPSVCKWASKNNVWMWSPEKFNMLSPDDVEKIRR